MWVILLAGAKSAAARAASTANNPTSSSGYTTSSMYGGGGYGSAAEARQPLNQQEYGGSKVGSTNYRGMNVDVDDDRHHAHGHGSQDNLLGDELPAAKSSFAGFEDVAAGTNHFLTSALSDCCSCHCLKHLTCSIVWELSSHPET